MYALLFTTDGIFNDVDAARETHAADLVALIIEEPAPITYCGPGFLNSTASSAFSVTHRTSATGNCTFAHKLSHNIGARHDWYVDDSANYHKGFIKVTYFWRTVMAYNNLCGEQGFNCYRLQY